MLSVCCYGITILSNLKFILAQFPFCGSLVPEIQSSCYLDVGICLGRDLTCGGIGLQRFPGPDSLISVAVRNGVAG